MKRARKPKPPPSVNPWPIAILAVDTASMSGWAYFRNGYYIHSGEWPIEKRESIEAFVGGFIRDVDGVGLRARTPAVLVLERPFGGSNSGTLMALGAARHVWLTAWNRAGGSERRIVRVYPQTWRSAVLGMTRGAELALGEKYMARGIKNGIDVGPDEAAAICIGKWACHAGEVGQVLPAKVRRAVLP